MEVIDVRCERTLEQQTAAHATIRTEMTELSDMVKKFEARAAAVEKTLAEKPKDPPPVNALAGLDRIMKPEQQQKFMARQANLFKEIESRAKNTAQAQLILYKASDETARFLKTPGATKKYYHVTRAEAGLGLGTAMIVGVGLGVGGTLLLQGRNLRKAGYTREDHKNWLAEGRDRVEAAKKK